MSRDLQSNARQSNFCFSSQVGSITATLKNGSSELVSAVHPSTSSSRLVIKQIALLFNRRRVMCSLSLLLAPITRYFIDSRSQQSVTLLGIVAVSFGYSCRSRLNIFSSIGVNLVIISSPFMR